MKKFLAAAAITLLPLAAFAPVASAAETGSGNAYGKVVQTCLQKSVGEAITNGKAAHPGASMTAKTIALSPHCAV